jgi:hypothetical protein
MKHAYIDRAFAPGRESEERLASWRGQSFTENDTLGESSLSVLLTTSLQEWSLVDFPLLG